MIVTRVVVVLSSQILQLLGNRCHPGGVEGAVSPIVAVGFGGFEVFGSDVPGAVNQELHVSNGSFGRKRSPFHEFAEYFGVGERKRFLCCTQGNSLFRSFVGMSAKARVEIPNLYLSESAVKDRRCNATSPG